MTQPGPAPPAQPGADAIDRWFARLFVAIAALSWTGIVLAELGRFRLVSLLALGVGALAIGLVALERALRHEAATRTSPASLLIVVALTAVAAAAVLPPGDPLVAGADESVYLNLANRIRRDGAILSADPLLAQTPRDDWPRLFSQDRFWPQRLNQFDGGIARNVLGDAHDLWEVNIERSYHEEQQLPRQEAV